MKEIVIDVTPQGKVEGMHHDCFSLAFLGAQSIHRASDIRFSPDTQTWGVWVACDPEGLAYEKPAHAADGFATYDGARRFEVEWFNQCRKQGCAPRSPEGHVAAFSLRSGFTEA